MNSDLPLVHISRPRESPTPAPAAILLHGRGANERDLLSIGSQFPEDMHVLSLRAPRSLGGPNQFAWYDLTPQGSNGPGSHFEESLEQLHAFIKKAIDRYDLDPNQIGVLGFSQGAVMSLALLVSYPELFRWVVALNGCFPDTISDNVSTACGKPVFIGYGRNDQIITPDRPQAAAQTLTSGGADVTLTEYDVGHGISPEEITDILLWLSNYVEIRPD